MLRISRSVLLATLFLSSVVIAAVMSHLIWGYPFTPPSPAPLIEQFDSITAIHLVQVDHNLNISIVSEAPLPQGEVVDYPPSRIIPIIGVSVPRSNQAPNGELLNILSEKLRWHSVETGYIHHNNAAFTPEGNLSTDLQVWGLVEDGSLQVVDRITQVYTPNDIHYYSLLNPSGYLVEGLSAEGERLIFVNLSSTQVNNDSYRYYEFAFSVAPTGELSLVGENQYNYDVAGFEFFSFPFIFVFVLMLLSLVWLMAALLSWIIRTATSQLRLRTA